MSCNEQIHFGDIGTVFRLTIEECIEIDGVNTLVPVNLTLVNTVEIYFGKPALANVKKAATVYDAVNGIVQYVTVKDDLNDLGSWDIQAKAIFTVDSQEHHSSLESFSVHKNIEIIV